MNFKVIIPARANSKRLPGKNMRILGGKPLIKHSIDYALSFFSKDDIWVNSDDENIIKFSNELGIKTLIRPDNLGTDYTTTVDVLKHQINYFQEQNIPCDSIILLQPTNPFRDDELLEKAIFKFKLLNRNSLATFSVSEKKMGVIEDEFYKPTNYKPGQRSQDLEKSYFENGLLYITKCDSILKGEVITGDVYPLICSNIESTVDIDYLEDFIFAESLLKIKK